MSVNRKKEHCYQALDPSVGWTGHKELKLTISVVMPREGYCMSRLGWGNLSLAFGLPSHENLKLTTSGKIVVPLPQMVLPPTIPVLFLAESGFH